jgi:hypothetical protein
LSLFFSPRAGTEQQITFDESILTFAPLLTNQRANRAGSRKDTWSFVVNGAEVRELPTASVISGDFREWKLAMWGSFRDGKLLSRIAKRFPAMAEFSEQNNLRVHQGFELRAAGSGKETQTVPEIAGRTQVDFSKLKNCGRIFAFPPESLSAIPSEKVHVRKRGGMTGLVVSEPPHVIVDASRRFAIYSDEFIAVPPRKIGISGPERTARLLKAMSIYLGSDFCTYQQFFTTPEWGVRTSLATLDALKGLPVPLGVLTDAELREWAEMQEELASESSGGVAQSDASWREINSRVYQLLGFSRIERILVEDFVRWNMQMIKGKVPAKVVAPPTATAVFSYLTTLKAELDEFVGRDSGTTHDLHAVQADDSAMISISLVHGEAKQPSFQDANEQTAAALAQTRKHLLRRHSQWLYFERCLKIYDDGAMYVFKPLEMIHWTRRQAILDAGEIIAETLGGQGE